MCDEGFIVPALVRRLVVLSVVLLVVWKVDCLGISMVVPSVGW